MIRPVDSLEQYKYNMSDVVFTYSDSVDPIEIPSTMVQNLSIKNSYDSNVSPAYMLTMTVPKKYYERIVTHMDTLTVTFTLYRIYLGYVDKDVDKNRKTDEDITQTTPYATLTLKALNDSPLSTVAASKLPKSDTANEETSDTIDYTNDLIPLNMYLYDSDNIKKYKINKSFIIDGGMNDCIYHMFKERGFEKLLVDPVSSNVGQTYSVPYGHLGDNLSKLDEYYGIYDAPYLFYIDMNRTYLLNKGNLGRCLQKGEFGNVHIYLEKLDERGTATETGCYHDKENRLYILNAVSFNIADNDTSIDYLAGGNITTVIRGTGEIKKDKIGEYNIERSYVVNNEKQHDHIIYNIKESKRSVTLIFNNVDLSIFTPNKLFSIIPDDTFYSKDYKIEGDYRLTGTNIIINRHAEGDFKCTVQISLNKVPEK